MQKVCLWLIAFLLPVAAFAAIEKFAVSRDSGILLYWWPKLTPLKGWGQDKANSYHYGFNALAPAGYTFSNAETVMYAKADYKPREPEIKSLGALIEQDKKNFISDSPDIKIMQTKSLHTADRKTFISYYFFPGKNGNWERVSYGEEGDFYITFAISSRSKEGLAAAEKDYIALVENYKE
jgi:hypothetical protein